MKIAVALLTGIPVKRKINYCSALFAENCFNILFWHTGMCFENIQVSLKNGGTKL
jgi:hypothetical protein